VAAGYDEVQRAALGSEDKANLQPGATFEIVASETPNSQAGMKMRFAKTGLDRIDHTGNLATTRPGEPANLLAKPR